ncbi:GNAT family N-acetyltransferase [Paenibacillus sp. GCM10028914]|uniref:GNAT family N-acetyltransferase n=1 Tax=Paenibacillus sp. GCM10028914 TaxID=3273416 RepID=UPI00360BF2DD
MMNEDYRKLAVEECEQINDMNPSQYIKNAWREVDGRRQLVEINYQDSDWPNGYAHHLNSLKSTIQNDGYAVGAFDNSNKLIGFATLNREFFGEDYKYVLLDQLFISLEHRNKGVGKKLFSIIADIARKWQADKIYICAGSAEETVAFYYAIGCTEAVELNEELYENGTRDFQMEFLL